MNLNNFQQSLTDIHPPANASVYLMSLWYDAKGNWEKAHKIIQDVNDKSAGWIHAYLHRKEGDASNADYWYNKAGKKMPAITLAEEWEEIVRCFCDK